MTPHYRPRSALHCLSLFLTLVALSLAVSAQEAASAPERPSSREARPAWQAPRASHALLLDVAQTADALVAVGEHGIVMLSADRNQWHQAAHVPVGVTLTAVTFSGRSGWAVGHDGVIIATADGGENWKLQHRDAAWGWPLLDVLFLDPKHGFAIGSYGTALETRDSGENWEKRELIPDLDWHLNAMVVVGPGHLFIAGEQGYGYRSADQGASWEEVKLPYEGSMFGVLAHGGEIISFGLRGHVFSSKDFGTSWTDEDPGPVDSLFAGSVLSNGRITLVGAKGRILTRLPGSEDFKVSLDPEGRDLAAISERDNGDLILFGEGGIQNFPLPKEP